MKSHVRQTYVWMVRVVGAIRVMCVGLCVDSHVGWDNKSHVCRADCVDSHSR